MDAHPGPELMDGFVALALAIQGIGLITHLYT
jgi:hypothetical protein